MDGMSSDVFRGVRRLDVLETGRRRRWTDEAKQRIVEEAFQRGVSVLTVARRHDVDPSQIYDWRRRLFPQISRGISGFAPVVVTVDRRRSGAPPNSRQDAVIATVFLSTGGPASTPIHTPRSPMLQSRRQAQLRWHLP
jgi:transposase